MKLTIIFALTLSAIHAQEQPAYSADSVNLAYQTARANAIEAENAVLKRTVADNALTISMFQAALNQLMTEKYGNPQALQAKQAETAKALEALKPKEPKERGTK